MAKETLGERFEAWRQRNVVLVTVLFAAVVVSAVVTLATTGLHAYRWAFERQSWQSRETGVIQSLDPGSASRPSSNCPGSTEEDLLHKEGALRWTFNYSDRYVGRASGAVVGTFRRYAVLNTYGEAGVFVDVRPIEKRFQVGVDRILVRTVPLEQ